MPLIDQEPKGRIRDDSARFALGVELYGTGNAAGAYQLFRELVEQQGNEASAALLVNLALCHLVAGQWGPAVLLLDRALAGMKEEPSAPPSDDETAARLEVISQNGYQAAMPANLPALLPALARERVQRLLIDALAQLGQWDRVRGLAAPLAPKGYTNVQAALQQVDQL